ncbi:unnamed protein product [Closterium sp. NIES-54]
MPRWRARVVDRGQLGGPFFSPQPQLPPGLLRSPPPPHAPLPLFPFTLSLSRPSPFPSPCLPRPVEGTELSLGKKGSHFLLQGSVEPFCYTTLLMSVR